MLTLLTEFMGLHISDMEDAGWKVIEDPEELESILDRHLGYVFLH